MPFDPKVIADLVQAGGWTLFVVHVAIDGVGLMRRWWTPGYLWLQERRERLKSDLQAAANARALARQARATAALAKHVGSIDEQLVGIARDVRQLLEARGDGASGRGRG